MIKQPSNLELDVLLEDRDALSRKVREEVSPTSEQWGFTLGSTYIRKVAFRDAGMIKEIERKVVNRLRQVTASMRQDGENRVAIISSKAEKEASRRLGQADAVRPKIVGEALSEIRGNDAVAAVLFDLLDLQATLKSEGKIAHIGASLHDSRPDQGVKLAEELLHVARDLVGGGVVFRGQPIHDLAKAARAVQFGDDRVANHIKADRPLGRQ